MKKYIWMLVVPLMLISCGEEKKNQKVEIDTPEEVNQQKANVPGQFDQAFVDGMTGTLWNYYSKIRMALVASDLDAAQTASGDIAESFGDKYPKLAEVARQMEDTEDLDTQRALFSELSEGLEPIFREALSEGAIYKQHCPMAFDNQGANWLASTKEIRNPYFGDKMLNCGSNMEVIKS